jgi:hypothetical protein
VTGRQSEINRCAGGLAYWRIAVPRIGVVDDIDDIDNTKP